MLHYRILLIAALQQKAQIYVLSDVSSDVFRTNAVLTVFAENLQQNVK